MLALEFRGRGGERLRPGPARYIPLTYAGDVIELLDQLGIAQAIFVGTSLGGLVTMGIAAIAPQRIAAAILNDVGPELSKRGTRSHPQLCRRDLRFASWDEAARRYCREQPSCSASYTHEDWVRMAHRTCREEDGEIGFDYDMAIAAPFTDGGSRRHSSTCGRCSGALAQKPLLVIRGESSDLLSAAGCSEDAERGAGMQLAVVPGVGHAPELDEPEAVAAIDEFLRAL